MRKRFLSCVAASLCYFAISQATSAAIIYVDATAGAAGNTTLANGATFAPPLNGTTGADNNWEQRTPFGSGGTIFESGGENVTENAPELRTRITGLTAGQQYSVFTYFWDPASVNEDWSIRAGLSSNPGANALFAAADTIPVDHPTATAAVLASSQTFATAPTIFSEGARNLLAASLGIVTADALGQIDIFIDDLPTSLNVNRRSWHDGVGYEAVAIPEPSSMALVGLGVAAYAARRRKRSSRN